ncbi:MAG: nickel-dependent lactate racemase [Candidatus Hydrogenedentes bacterium]|nr:nickel-dependent lactate racemase [Candidatus Hydrogenedentota bacterium]
MIVSLPYRSTTSTAEIPWAQCLGILSAAKRPQLPDIALSLRHSLKHPIGIKHSLRECFHPHESVVLAVSDASRTTGMEQILPHLVDWLLESGLVESHIRFLVATGVHRPATTEEHEHILGASLYKRFKNRIHNHNAHDTDNLISVGTTRRGTQVMLNRYACECDHLILTGTVMPHYFAGFGGGRKALVPGLSGASTIAQNHVRSLHPSLPRLDPRVRICVLDDNPVAEDLLEGAQLHPPTFIINTVLGKEGTIAGLFTGELNAAHRRACTLARDIYTIPITEQADLVIAAINTAPNFVQCHKALFNAYSALKPGGRIILLAPAPEGLGASGFRRYLEMGEPERIASVVRQHPDVNGQTALSTLQKTGKTLLVTELNHKEVALLGAEKMNSLEEALLRTHDYFNAQGISHPTCYVMPNAGNTVPIYHEK